MGILIYRVMFKVKYRIIPYNDKYVTIEVKRWYMLFWVRLNLGMLFNNIEDAKKFIESHRNPIML